MIKQGREKYSHSVKLRYYILAAVRKGTAAFLYSTIFPIPSLSKRYDKSHENNSFRRSRLPTVVNFYVIFCLDYVTSSATLVYKFISEELTEREREIICKRYGVSDIDGSVCKPLTQREIAKKLNISRIEKRALEKLRARFEKE